MDLKYTPCCGQETIKPRSTWDDVCQVMTCRNDDKHTDNVWKYWCWACHTVLESKGAWHKCSATKRNQAKRANLLPKPDPAAAQLNRDEIKRNDQ